jgi:hypothetical protein
VELRRLENALLQEYFPGKDLLDLTSKGACRNLLSDLCDEKLLHEAGRKYKLTDPAGRTAAAQAYAAANEEAGAAGAAGRSDVAAAACGARAYCDGAGAAGAGGADGDEKALYKSNAAPLAEARQQLSDAHEKKAAEGNKIQAYLERTAAPMLKARDDANAAALRCEREEERLEKERSSTASSLVRELMPLVVGAMPTPLGQPRCYRLFVQNCGACSGGGRSHASALLATTVDMLRAAGADLAVLLEVPDNRLNTLTELHDTLRAAAGGDARWRMALSVRQRGERVAFLWDPSRVSLDDDDGAALPPVGPGVSGGRAPVACGFKPVNSHHRLDVTVYGCAMLWHLRAAAWLAHGIA